MRRLSLSAVPCAALLCVGAAVAPATAAPEPWRAPAAVSQSAGATAEPVLDWFLRTSNAPGDGSAEAVSFGEGGVPLACSLNGVGGRGSDEPAETFGAIWSLQDDGTPVQFRWGRDDDFQLCGDWDGDGIDTPAVVRGKTFFFATRNGAGSPATSQTFGLESDYPVVGDWDGDGYDTIGVVRGNAWYLSNVRAGAGNARAQIAFSFGRADDYPIAGDWDGDGTDSIGVVRERSWFLSGTEGAGPRGAITALTYGRGFSLGDFPVNGDWDGDGTDTPAVVRYTG